MKCTYLTTVLVGIILLAATAFAMPPVGYEPPTNNGTRNWDNDTYINAANILMFVTNHGGFGYDVSMFFGKAAGTYYPYVSIEDIESGLLNNTVLYAAGLWVGGKVDNQIRLVISEHDDEYVPGPMANGTFQPNDPSFRVYKLYRDSLAFNPNSDYLSWPVDQGAPVDELGNPMMLGDQMLWTVYNDADPAYHTQRNAGTDPLGIEVQQTVWATRGSVQDTVVVADEIEVTQAGSVQVEVRAFVTDQSQLSQDSYAVDIMVDPLDGPMWQLRNVTTGTVIIAEQVDFFGHIINTDEGFAFQVSVPNQGFAAFQVAANGGGVLEPPVAGALDFAGFPTGEDGSGMPLRPGDDQQLGDGLWGFHTADNGGTSGGGTRCCFEDFLARATRNGDNYPYIGNHDFEMRFTGDNATPGVGGSYAAEAFNDDNVFWVPFELWNIGIGTPDDPSDDVRLVPLIIDNGDDNIYNLESWGIHSYGGGDLEHSASGADNDPFTDWVYWNNPEDMSAGEAGYLANEADMLDGVYSYGELADEVFARTVLINWNGGDAPPFNQDVPEQGTVFRIVTTKSEIEPDLFTFTPSTALHTVEMSSNTVIGIKYKLYNKGGNTIEDAYISLWSDPDLGYAGDDLVGCDTLLDLIYCYNADNDDEDYGSTPPAVGFRIVTGPIVPGNPDDTADFDGVPMPGFKNLPMTSVSKWVNPYGPEVASESYNCMLGLMRSGSPYVYNGDTLSYMRSGDPVTNSGDLDINPADQRIMGSCGPMTILPGDSQYIFIQMGVGQGSDRLSSITALKWLLTQPPPQPVMFRVIVEPDPVSMIMLNAIEPIEGVVTFGYDADGPFGEAFEYGGLTLTGLPPIDSTVILPSYEGFNGPVARFYFPLSDLLTPYQPLWDFVQHSYTVSGYYTDDLTPLSFEAALTIHGHISGDLNLDGHVDISDLVFMVDYFFTGGPAPELLETADLDHSGAADISDLVLMIGIMFGQ